MEPVELAMFAERKANARSESMQEVRGATCCRRAEPWSGEGVYYIVDWAQANSGTHDKKRGKGYHKPKRVVDR